MSSGLTLSQARTSLPTAALSAQNAATASLAAAQINPALSWLITSGKWRGTMQRVVFEVQDDSYITLPRSLQTILAGVIQGTDDNFRCNLPLPIQNEWFQWIPGGPGFNPNPPYCTQGLNSLGEGFVFFKELPSSGQIKVVTTTTETANSINIRGYNSSGDKVFTGTGASRIEGENITIPTVSGNSVTTSTTWNEGNSVYGVVKPSTNGVLLVYHTSGGTDTLIARYEPGEQVPNYRRYLVPSLWINEGQIVAWCKVAFVPAVVDNDQLIPGNLNALEMALMAVRFRRTSEMDRAIEYFQLAIQELNDEVEDFNAESSYPVMQIPPTLSLGPCSNVI